MADLVRVDEVVRLTAAGFSAPRIAERLGVSSRTVTRDRVLAGIAQPHLVHPPELWARAGQLLAEGMNFTQVASVLGVSTTRLACRFPDVPRLSPQECGHIAELYRQAGI